MLKIKNDIFKILIEIFVFDKKKRSKIKARWAKRHLKKYVDMALRDMEAGKGALDTDFHAKDGPKASEINPGDEIIWQYWHQGKENAPELIKKCFESVEKFEGAGGAGRKIVVLSFDTVKDYIEIPKKYYDLVEDGKMKIPHFSDIVRLYLLNRFGGAWIDSTIYLTGGIPDKVWDSDFCVFQKDRESDPQENIMTCYFIRAKKASKNVFGILRALQYYWGENDFCLNYFMFEHISTMLKEAKGAGGGLGAEWAKIPRLSADLAGKLQTVLFDEFKKEDWEAILGLCPIHKLSYKILKNKTGENTYYDWIMVKENK